MPPKKPKEVVKRIAANSGEYQYLQNVRELTTILSADTEGAKKKSSACLRCKTRKIKCVQNGSASACLACTAGGLQAECMAASKPSSQGSAQRTTQARSHPPATTTSTVGSTKVSTCQQQTSAAVEGSDRTAVQGGRMNRIASKKRGYSDSEPDNSQSITGHQHIRARRDKFTSVRTSSSGQTSSLTTQTVSATLDAIDESDEDRFENDSKSESSEVSMDVHHDQKDRITTSLVHGGADAFSNDSDSSENDDSSDMEIVSNPVPKQQQKCQTKLKKPAQRKSQPSNKRRVKPTDDDELDTDSSQYDPVTCGASMLYYRVLTFLTCLLVFKIPSLAKSTDGSNSPFVIESSITLEELRNTIAERLGRHPNVIQLRYKLANDKVKAPVTSI